MSAERALAVELQSRLALFLRDRLAWVALGAALVVPHVLYAFRDTFGDEHAIVANALSFLAKKTLIPASTSYPTLYSYLATPFVALGAVGYAWAGKFGSARDAVAVAISDDRWALVVGPRVLSIALLVAVAVVCARGLRGRFGAGPAYLAAALILTSPSLSERATFALPDVLVLLFCFTSFLCLVAHVEGEGRHSLYLAAALAGFACSAKYNGAAAALPIAYVLLRERVRGETRVQTALARAAGAAGAFVLAFLIGTPGWVIAPKLYANGLLFEIEHAEHGHLGSSGIPLLGQLELLLMHEPIWLALGVAGLLYARRSREPADHVALALLVSGFAVAALSRKQSIQYLYPALPALFYFGTSSVRRALAGARWKLAALAVLVLAGAGVNLEKGISAAFEPSTTELARRWIYQNVPPESEIALETNYVPRLFSDASLARIESDRLKGGPRVAAFLRSQHPRYRVTEFACDQAWLRSDTATEFIVTSESAYDRFFRQGLFTGRAPRADSALGAEFAAKKAFYSELFSSGRWQEVYDVSGANGPRTRIYARRPLAARSEVAERW